MRDLAPDITRQRLLVEGYYTCAVDRDVVVSYLRGVASELELRTYGEPTVHSPGGEGRPENQGFDAFIPLIDSGISLYVWGTQQFFSSILFTCKAFDSERAVAFTQRFFGADDVAWREF